MERLALGEGRGELSAVLAAAFARDVEPAAPREVCGLRVQLGERVERARANLPTPGRPAPLLMRLAPRKAVLTGERPVRVEVIEAAPERSERVSVAREVAGALAEHAPVVSSQPMREWRVESVARGMAAARPGLGGGVP